MFEGFDGPLCNEQIKEPGGEVAARFGVKRIFHSDMILSEGGEGPFPFGAFYPDDLLLFRDVIGDRRAQNGNYVGIGVLAGDEVGNEIPIADGPGEFYLRIVDEFGGRHLLEEDGGFCGIYPVRSCFYVQEDGHEPGKGSLQD